MASAFQCFEIEKPLGSTCNFEFDQYEIDSWRELLQLYHYQLKLTDEEEELLHHTVTNCDNSTLPKECAISAAMVKLEPEYNEIEFEEIFRNYNVDTFEWNLNSEEK